MSEVSCVLPESIKIDSVVSIKQQLGDSLADDSSVLMDGSQVLAIDFSGVQLLLVFTRELNSRGHKLAWSSVSEPLRAAVADLNAESHLGL